MERLTEKGKQYQWFDFEDDGIDIVMEKLQKLEDLEEQIGMPLDILARVFDERCLEIWIIDGNSIYSHCIDGFRNGMFYEEDYCHGCRMDDILFNPKEYGLVWFLTQEEAEKKLEEIKNG